jgi:hypothetical protein
LVIFLPFFLFSFSSFPSISYSFLSFSVHLFPVSFMII